jgi:HK97 family phage major capsid protein
MAYNDRFARTPDANRTAREIPEEVVSTIIKDAEQTSVALRLGNVRRMNAYQTRLRLQASFPGAFWINGTTDVLGGAGGATQVEKDSAFKQTTQFQWTNEYLTPDELAVLAVMPDNWRADSDIAWDEIRTALRTAFAQAIDRAIFFGDSAFGALPASFGSGLVAEATLAGNFVVEGTGVDLADDYAELAQGLEEGGYSVSGFVTRAAEEWRLRRLREAVSNAPIYTPLSSAGPGTLYGRGLDMVTNGTWDNTEATAVAGDWSQLHIGVRQDMTFDMSNSAPIFDPSDGSLVYNPFQQDGEVLRAVLRLGYVITAPLKHLGGVFPFSVLLPVGYSS